jgi:hypothetical protein
MPSVEAAKLRLERAIARLESAARARPVAAANSDQTELVRALEAAQSENAALQDAADQAAAGLDRAISRLKAVLED